MIFNRDRILYTIRKAKKAKRKKERKEKKIDFHTL